ncbi:MAG: helix-turn-helix transcriptional regulator [Clostridia bacterium]|nr:helix-turn-helix transcriptional regulator [Clostridia bacterium]
MKIFGERVKKELKEQGWTQRTLASAICVQTSTLCEWLNDHNEPPMQSIVDIAKALDVSTDYLLGLKDNEMNCQTKSNTF